MKINITLNGTQILAEDTAEKTREALATIATTQNIDAKGVQESVAFLGKGYSEALGKIASRDAKLEITQDGEKVAEYKLGNFVQRMRDALTSELRKAEFIKTEKSAKVSQPSAPVLPTLG